MAARDIKVSKFLARILRHKPEAAGLMLDRNGWASVEAVLAALSERFGPFGLAELKELVSTNDKRRYVLSDDGQRIRAAQGHSVEVDLELQAISPPPLLFHGTSLAALPSILGDGLRKGRRHHVHLSEDIATAIRVGARRTGKTVVLQIDSAAMKAHSFYLSANGVWLTDYVPPNFITPIVPEG